MQPAKENAFPINTKLFIYLILIVYFALPKSYSLYNSGDFRLIGDNLGPWHAQRYILAAISSIYIFLQLVIKRRKHKRIHVCIFLLALSLCCIQLLNLEYEVFYALLGILVAYYLHFDTQNIHISRKEARAAIIICSLYLLQYAAYRVGERITSSFLDPNIAGYYLFLCYCIFRYQKCHTLAAIAAIIGMLSLSRNFYLAIFIFELLKFRAVEETFKEKLRIRSPLVITTASIIAVIAGSLYITNFNSYNETIGETSRRLTNLNDGSNYARASANIDFISRVTDGEFILFGNGSNIDDQTDHRPHNAFLRASYRYGLPLALISTLCFLYFSRRIILKNYALYISLFTYYSLLNDFISGLDLALLICISTFCSRPIRRAPPTNWEVKNAA